MSPIPEPDERADGRREIVLHPRTAAARRVDRGGRYASHVRGHAAASADVLALMAEQRRLGVRLLGSLLLPTFVFLVVLGIRSGVGSGELPGGVIVPWLLVGPIGLSSIVAIAWFHERRANRIERRWSATHIEERS